MFTIPVAIFVSCVISAAIAFVAVRRRHSSAKADLGALSDNWIAEYRLGRGTDGQN